MARRDQEVTDPHRRGKRRGRGVKRSAHVRRPSLKPSAHKRARVSRPVLGDYLPGVLALAFILGVIVAAFVGLFLSAEPQAASLPWRYVGGVVRFTLLQAALSTAISLVLGRGAGAGAGAPQQFPGRSLFIAALNLASVLPAIVAVFGIVAVLGRAGWVGQAAAAPRHRSRQLALRAAGHPDRARLLQRAARRARLPRLARRGAGRALAARRAARHGPGAIFRIIDWPVLKREAPCSRALIFLLCFTSFAIVLALGGGPGAATLEVAIYDAVRFDVDFARAGLLALLQVAICLVIALPLLWFMRRPGETARRLARSLSRPGPDEPPDANARLQRRFRLARCSSCRRSLAISPSGLAALASLLRPDVLEAVADELRHRDPRRGDRTPPGSRDRARGSAAAFCAPPAIRTARRHVAAGRADPRRAAGRGFRRPLRRAAAGRRSVRARHPADRSRQRADGASLCAAAARAAADRFPPSVTAGLPKASASAGLSRIRLVDWPLLRRPFAAAFAVAIALSLGDLGVAAFFGSGNILTLPLLLYQRMGAYRIGGIASVALLLRSLVLGAVPRRAKMVGRPACSKPLTSRSTTRTFTPSTR